VKLRRFLAPLLLALALLVALLFVIARIPLRQARDAWRAGRDADALATAQRWSQMRLWPAEYAQILAAASLTSGRNAQPYLASIGHPLWSVLAKEEVARRLFAKQQYADFLAYDAASYESREAPDVALYRAAALAATNRVNDAAAALNTIHGNVDATKLMALRQAIAARTSGSVPYVFDRDGAPIATWRVASNDVMATNADFAPLVDRTAGALTIGAQLPKLGTASTIDTTLDPFMQRAALAALGKYHGSIVVIDPKTNEVLAIASNSDRNLALEQQYEPGSVIKVLTGLNALSGNGIDVRTMFPYVCKGELMIDGRHFGDWLPQGHGTLTSINDALAVSCNVYFADVGVRMGRDRLQRFMRTAGFEGQTNPGLFEIPLGKFRGDVFNNFETAFLAIGLQHETINAFHLAMLASMVANRGVMTTPRLLRGRRSILGEQTEKPAAQGRVQLASPAAAEAIIAAMQSVATNPRGTGRRAPIPGISLAMKTGTAGERAHGLQALILAFAPVESPKLAFGIIAEDAGPAEYAGAEIAHEFLERVKTKL